MHKSKYLMLTSLLWPVFTLAAGSRLMSPGTFYNPATLVSQRLETDPAQLTTIHDRKILIGMAINKLKSSYTGSSSFRNPLPFGPNIVTATGPANNDITRYIPAFNWSIRLNPRWIAGVKVGQPFNAAIEYPADSSTRYTGYSSSIMAVNVAPEVAYQFNDKLSAGFGPELQRIWFQFAAAVPVPVSRTPNSAMTDYQFKNNLDAWGGGWFWGLFYRPRQSTFLGVTYYSSVDFHLTGESTLNGSGGLRPANAYARSRAKMITPWSIRIDAFQAINRQWGINASIEHVQWSQLQRILLQNTALGEFSQQYSYSNTQRYSLGARFQPNEKWSFFAGAAYHESPSDPHLQRPITPDKHFVSAGFAIERYFSPEVAFKLNYRHGFIGRSQIDYTSPITSALGQANAQVDTVDIILTLRK